MLKIAMTLGVFAVFVAILWNHAKNLNLQQFRSILFWIGCFLASCATILTIVTLF